MDDKLNLLIKTFGEERFKVDENLIFHTFNKLDVVAKCFYVATNKNELIDILNSVTSLEIPFLVLGGGTKATLKKRFEGLVIKNRTSNMKISAVKGKVGKGGIGVEEAITDVDSGVSLGKLNEFLYEQNLATIDYESSLNSTVGGALFYDRTLKERVQKIKVWQDQVIDEIELAELDQKNHIIISADTLQ